MQPLKETYSEFPTSSSGSDRSKLTVVEYLRDPAIPIDWMFNIGLRSVWRQAHEQLIATQGPYVLGFLPTPDLSTIGHIKFSAISGVNLIYGLYKVNFSFFSNYDIDVLGGTVNFSPNQIGNYYGIPCSTPSPTNHLYLKIVERRFESTAVTSADLEGGTPGNNAYGNLDPANDLKVTFGSNTYDTHNEWRAKAVLYTRPAPAFPILPTESADTRTVDLLIATFGLDNSGNVINFNYVIPVQHHPIGELLKDYENQSFAASHRVAFTNSKNRFTDTQSMLVYNTAKVDSNGVLVHSTTNSALDLKGNCLVISSAAAPLKVLPTDNNRYPEGTILYLVVQALSGISLDISFTGNIVLNPAYDLFIQVYQNRVLVNQPLPIVPSGRILMFQRIGSSWIQINDRFYDQMILDILQQLYDQTYVTTPLQLTNFITNTSGPGSTYLVGTFVYRDGSGTSTSISRPYKDGGTISGNFLIDTGTSLTYRFHNYADLRDAYIDVTMEITIVSQPAPAPRLLRPIGVTQGSDRMVTFEFDLSPLFDTSSSNSILANFNQNLSLALKMDWITYPLFNSKTVPVYGSLVGGLQMIPLNGILEIDLDGPYYFIRSFNVRGSTDYPLLTDNTATMTFYLKFTLHRRY